MGHHVVDASGDQPVGHPFHVADAKAPAVRAECLAHQAAFLFRLHKRDRRAHFRLHVMVELAVRHTEAVAEGIRVARNDLTADVIDAGHRLAAHGPEEMARAAAQAAVLIFVLNDVPDVLHAAVFAPFPELFGKVCGVERGHHVHVCIAHFRCLFFILRRIP